MQKSIRCILFDSFLLHSPSRNHHSNPSRPLIPSISSSFTFSHNRFCSTTPDIDPKNSVLANYLIDYLKFPKRRALSVCSSYARTKSLENPKEVVHFFRGLGFSDARIQSTAYGAPLILFSNVEKILKPKVTFLQESGLSGPNLCSLISKNPNVLMHSLDRTLKPCLRFIFEILRSGGRCVSKEQVSHDLLRILTRSSPIVRLKSRMDANIPYLRSCGIDGSQLSTLLLVQPRLLALPKEKVCTPSFADCHQLVPPAVSLCSFDNWGKMSVFESNRTTVFSPNFGRDSSSAIGYSLMPCWLHLGRISRGFCTIEALELDKTPDFGETDSVVSVYKTVLDHSKPEYKMEEALDKLGIELTTPLVIEVLHRLHFEERVAFRFFNWAGHQENYSHEPESYNKMIDILSNTKYKVKLFRIVCDLLDYMKRHGKKLVPIEVLLDILRKYTEKHLTHLSKFAKKKKIRVKTQPEINAFNMLLDALCKCCLVEEAELILYRVRSKIKPNADTYNILFFGWCRVRNPSRGMSVLESMINMGYAPENFTYNTAIDTYCKSGMLKEAGELLEFMKSKGSTMSSPTAKTYAIMMVALVQNDRMEEFFTVLADMIDSGCLPDVSTYKELIDGMCSCGKIEAAYKFLEEMGRTSYPSDIVTYNCFLKVLCDNKNSEEAFRLYHKMIDAGCTPSVQTYNIMIEMFFMIGKPDGAFDAWDEMERRGCFRDTETYSLMIEGLFGCGNTKDASVLLDEVINSGMKLPYKKFDVFLMQLSAAGDLRSIHRLSEHMRKFYNPAMARRFAVNQKRKSKSLRDSELRRGTG